jgi:hypothetical protein
MSLAYNYPYSQPSAQDITDTVLSTPGDYLGVGTPHTLSAAITSLSQTGGVNPKGPPFNAKGDGRIGTGNMTSGSASLATVSTNYVVGMMAVVIGAGPAGASLVTTVDAIPDAGHVTLHDAASTAVSGTLVRYGTKDSTALQAAIDYAVTNRLRVETPSGRFMLDVPLQAPRGSTGAYFSLELEGAGSAYDASSGTNSLTTFDASGLPSGVAFFVNSARGVRFKDFAIVGPNPLPTTAGVVLPLSSIQANYITPGVRIDRYSPNAAICIDGLRSADTTPPAGGGYPGQVYGFYTASSAVRFENVTIQRFAVGVMNSPASFATNQQGDDVYFYDSRIYHCDIACAAGQSQTRGCTWLNGSMGSVRCCFDGVTYGQQQGQIPLLNEIVIGYAFALFNIDPGWSYVKIGTAYLEGCVTIGRAFTTASSQNALDLGTMYWKRVADVNALAPPLILETSAPTTFKGELLDFSATAVPVASQGAQNAYNIAGGGMFHCLNGTALGRHADEVQLGWVDSLFDQVRVTDLRTNGSVVASVRKWGNPLILPGAAAGRFQPMRWQAEVLTPNVASASPYLYTGGNNGSGRRVFTATNVVNPGTAVMTFDVDAANLSLLHIGTDGDLLAWRVRGYTGSTALQTYVVPAYKLTSVTGAGPFTVTATALFDTSWYDITYATFLVVVREWAPLVPVTMIIDGTVNFTGLTNPTVVKPGDWILAASGLQSGTRIDTITGTNGTLKKASTTSGTITIYYGRLTPATLGTPLA